MPNYQYKARDKFSKPVTGIMSGESQDAVAAKLNQMGFIPISIEEKKEAAAGVSLTGSAG